MVRYTTLRTWMEWSTSCGHTHQIQIFKAGNQITLCNVSQRSYSVWKKYLPQTDTEHMFAEDEGQPEVETQPGDDSLSKNNEGKEQATKKQYMEAEYDTGSKVPEKLDISQYINDTSVTNWDQVCIDSKQSTTSWIQVFHQRNTKIKGRSSGFIKRYCQHSWFTDFDFIYIILYQSRWAVLHSMCGVSHRNPERTNKCTCLQAIHQLEKF